MLLGCLLSTTDADAQGNGQLMLVQAVNEELLL